MAEQANPGGPVNASAEVANIQNQSALGTPSSTADRAGMVPNDMGRLQKEEPELYRGILEGIAGTVLQRMRGHQRRMKKLMKDGYRWNT